MALRTIRNTDIIQDAPTYKILINGTPIETSIPVLSMSIMRAFNKISTAQIVLKDGQVGGGEKKKADFPVQNQPEFQPGNEIEIKIGHRGKNSYSVFKGVITGLKIRVRYASSRLFITCKSKAYRMTLQPKSRYFEDSTDSDIISTLTQAYGLSSEVEETEFNHTELVQYECSDWHFLINRAEHNSLFTWIDEADEIKVVKLDFSQEPLDVLEFGRDLYELDAEIDARTQYTDVNLTAWDYTTQNLLEQEAIPPILQEAGNLTGDNLAELIGNGIKFLRHSGYKLDAELQAKADAILLRDRIAKIKGRIKIKTVQQIIPGDLIDLKNVGDRFSGVALVSGIRYEFSSEGWRADIQLGFSNQWKHQETMNEHPSSLSAFVSPISGLQIGLVSQIHNDPEESNRIKVRLPLLGIAEEGIWARIAILDAGQNRGSFFMPEVDDEVIVGFINDDPKEAIVLGMLHSAAKVPPLEAKEANNQKGFFSREGINVIFDEEKKALTLETPGENRLKLDDQDKVLLEGANEILIKSPVVNISGDGGEAVVLGDTLNSNLDNFITQVDSLVKHLATFAGAQIGVTTLPPLTSLTPGYTALQGSLVSVTAQLAAIKAQLSQHLSTKVKSE